MQVAVAVPGLFRVGDLVIVGEDVCVIVSLDGYTMKLRGVRWYERVTKWLGSVIRGRIRSVL